MSSPPPMAAALHERLRAPREHGHLLSVPPLSEGVALAQENAARLATSPVRIAGRTLAEFRQWTRESSLTAGRVWMAQSLGISPPPPPPPLDSRLSTLDSPLFVTGHQPQLNHPGVWVKNFAVAALAQRSGGAGLNVIVDNDIAEAPAVRVPAGTREDPRFDEVFYDRPQPRQPWEERRVEDRELFSSFAERTAKALQAWGMAPSLVEFWPAALAALEHTDHAAVCLTASRVAQERRWGLSNLELPVSVLCQTEPFLAFLGECCRRHEELFAAYNEAIASYRRKYHIRNDRHPAPMLERRGDAWESPFWHWFAGARDRSRLFVRRFSGGVELLADDRPLGRLEREADDLAVLEEIQSQGRLRTRALTTTLFVRLALADLFVHGIGGARYDEITDALLSRFLGMPAPAFLTTTATLHLPLGPFAATAEDLRRLKRRLRDLRYSADKALGGAKIEELRLRRKGLVADAAAQRALGLNRRERLLRRGENRRRGRQLWEIQQELAALARGEIEATQAEIEQIGHQLRANSVLRSREFAAVLFPPAALSGLLSEVRTAAK